nr:MAG TPA_asm: hypothetical protein [Caudoviricetes sp.]
MSYLGHFYRKIKRTHLRVLSRMKFRVLAEIP